MAVVAIALASPATPATMVDSGKCLMCHSAKGLSKTIGGKQMSLHVEASELQQSVHAGRKCEDCHTDLAGQSFPHKQNADPVNCSRCHKIDNTVGAPNLSPMTEYADSVHGQAVKRMDKDAPNCKDCHGTHGIKAPSDPKSSTYRSRIAHTCGKCHSDTAMTERHNIPGPATIRLYRDSVHGKAVDKQGLLAAATCTDCHGIHNIEAAKEKGSTVSKPHIPATCGKCHQKIYKTYEESIHGQALRSGIKDAPSCTDCHGEHTIAKPSEERSSVYPTHVVATCSKCHEDMRIERKYGLPANRLSTYIESYHGVANKYGDITVANCATCHGAHDIRPASDPKSSINKTNMPKTCGVCHPGASKNFAEGSVHVLPSSKKDKGVYWVRIFYTGFIILLIGSFCAYIALDLISRWRRRSRNGSRGYGK